MMDKSEMVGRPTRTMGWTSPFSARQYHLWWNLGLFKERVGAGGFFCIELVEEV